MSDTQPAANEPQTDAQGFPEFIDVAEYRHDHGHRAWAWRCWGTDACDGWLSLDHFSEDSATRSARRHLALNHPAEPFQQCPNGKHGDYGPQCQKDVRHGQRGEPCDFATDPETPTGGSDA